ncbi:MAG: YajQ family cyclic di-GMP-binding protein, partial [Pseudomonadales bacterium]|nr:YajQ family cyclic di-GMP-binding protein [Pseudomonadales bacterium]
RGVEAKFVKQDEVVRITAEVEIQLDQMIDILNAKMIKRAIDPKVMDIGEQEHVGKLLHKNIRIQQGVESLLAKKIVKMIKEKKLKVQVAIQGDKVRVTGKKRDDLQQVIAMLREEEFEVPLQYNNFRD